MGLFDKAKGLFSRTDQNQSLIVSPTQVAKPTIRLDDFANNITSQGTGRDKKMWAYITTYILGVQELDTIYQGSDIAASIVDIPAQEMLRQGYQIKLTDSDNEGSQELLEAMKAEMDEHLVNEKLTQGEIFGRLYGGGGILLGVNDGLNPQDPLDLSKIKSVDYLALLDRYELVNAGIIDMNAKSKNFAKPDFYQLATIDPAMSGVRIHNSRIVRFDGIQMSRRRMAFFNYWGQSVINRIYNILRDYESSNSAIASMIQDFNVFVFKMADLAAIQSSSQDGAKLLQARLNMAMQMQSILNALIIRPEEELDYKTRNVTGADTLMDQITDRLVIAARVPRLLLLGKGQGGLNTNTDNEVRLFYDQLKSYQNNVLQQKLRQIINVFMASKTGPFAGNVQKFQIQFNPLWQLNETEMADVKLKTAQADQVYLQNGVYFPEEIAYSRYGTGKFSTDVIMDEALRGKVSKINKQTKANLNDPNLPRDRENLGTPNAMHGISSASAVYPQKKI